MLHNVTLSALFIRHTFSLIKEALSQVVAFGLKDDNSLFISFQTHFKGVILSSRLREKYPEEITIVLQYEYSHLKVTEEGFSVVLSFEEVLETLYVPFHAITTFADPSIPFGIQLRLLEPEEIPPLTASHPSKNVVSLEAYRKKDPTNS